MSATKLKVGITTILAILMLFVGIFWVKSYNPAKKKIYLTVAFADGRAITGGDPVQISGIRVGEVNGVTLDDTNRALVSFWMNHTHLGPDTKFTIVDVGLMGDKALVIEPGSAPGELDPDVIYTGDAAPDLGVLIDTAGSILARLDTITAKIDDDLDLKALIAGFDSTLGRFNSAIDLYAELASDVRDPLNRTLDNLETASEGMERFVAVKVMLGHLAGDDRLTEAIDSFRATSDRMASLLDGMQGLPAAVDTLSYYVSSGEGTLGRLITTDDLYEELRRTNAAIDSFVVDFKRDPGKYTKDMQFKVRLF